jgi:hypothetical protein
MMPEERKVFWEQEHLTEFQGIPLYHLYGHPMDDVQRTTTQQQQELSHDQHQQAMRIYDIQASGYQEEYRNRDLLDDKQQRESEALKQQQNHSLT